MSSACAWPPPTAPRCPPGSPAVTWTWCCPPGGGGSTRCAPTPPTAAATGSPCGASPTAAGARVEVHEALTEGSAVTVRGPRNAFPFIHTERYLFLAGGIGITPILPMVAAAARRGADWHLVYTGRSRASMPFLAELAGLAELDAGRVLIRPDDEYGIPTAAGPAGPRPGGRGGVLLRTDAR